MQTGAGSRGVALIRAGLDELLALPADGLGRGELVGLLEAVEVQRRRLEAVDQRLLAAAPATVVDVLPTRLCLDGAELTRRVARARDLGPRRALTGEPLEPILPVLAAAMQAGEVSVRQVEVIVWCLERIPPTAPPAACGVAERLLVEAARHEPPMVLRRTGLALLDRLDPDGLEPIEDRAHRRRSFTLIRNQDGTSSPRGVWTAELTAMWQAILDSLAAPQPATEPDDPTGTSTGEAGVGEAGTAEAAGPDCGDAGRQPDPRTAAQRRHDAMLEAATRLLRSATLPASAGVPVTVLATTTIAELSAAAQAAAAARDAAADPAAADHTAGFSLPGLAARSGLDPTTLTTTSTGGLAVLGHGRTVSVRSLLAVACEANLIPVIFNDAGGVLAFGRTKRLASRDQRLALVARDGGCSFPGCDRPPAWTEVHHVRPWAAATGGTDIDNLCLLCAYHHREFAHRDWQVSVNADGVPEWRPPAWLDPDQTPITNTTQHRPEIHFRQPIPA